MSEHILGGQCVFCHQRGEHAADCERPKVTADAISTVLSEAIGNVGKAITPVGAAGKDAAGGHVDSLTEAVMGVTAGLCRIADAIEYFADVVRALPDALPIARDPAARDPE